MSNPELAGTGVFVAHLDTADDVADVLATFERMFEKQTEMALRSSEFYSRYRAGEFDHPIGHAWATYYEAYLELRERGARELERAVPPAFAAC